MRPLPKGHDLLAWTSILGASRGLLRALGDLAYPGECLICGLDGVRPPCCDDCRAELLGGAGAACPRCAATVGPWESVEGGCVGCRGKSLGFDAAVALGPYAGPIRHLVLAMKHERMAMLADWLAGLVVEARGESIAFGPGALVAGVPLHWHRQWTRRYNQADALAAGLARRLGLAAIRPLRRRRATPKLAALSRKARDAMLKDAFVARRGATALKGRTVLLVDDVLTTGATCGAAARTLKRAGAARVVAVVVARAP